MADSYVVVPMGVEHVDGVFEVEKLAFSTPWSKEAFLQEVTENPRAFYLVVLDGDRVIAYAGSWIILDECHITNVAVHPEFRRQKIAIRLMEILREAVKLRGVLGITLEVRVSNLSAQNLYKQLGFVEQGVRKGYYTDNNEDALIMWLNL